VKTAVKKAIITMLALAAIPVAALAYTSPGSPHGYVSDFAAVLSKGTISDTEAKLHSLEQSTGVQVAVVTVPSLGGDTVENYAMKLFAEWGIGNKEKDTGLLILVAPNERKTRIEVGYGLEGTITDLQASNIINKAMIPVFKQGDYDTGVTGAVDAVISIVNNSPDAAQYSEPAPASASSKMSFGTIIFLIVIILNVLTRIFGATKSWWLGGVLGAAAGVLTGFVYGFMPTGLIAIPVLAVLGLLFDFIVSRGGPRGPGGGLWIFPGRFGGGSGGGGFGGFGGGSSGGGGASGGW
jgi:uncharacterized protein